MARVYVGTYRKYNNGDLSGKWIDLDDFDNEDDFIEACKQLHKDEPDPELMFQDFEGFPKEFYEESGLDDRLWEYLALNDDDQGIVDAYFRCIGDDGLEVADMVEKCEGQYDSMADCAEQFCEDCYGLNDVPDVIRCHIDWDGVGRDFLVDLDYDEQSGYIFNRNR